MVELQLKGCKKCGNLRSAPLKGPENQDLYWFGSPKDNSDFIFILSNLTSSFFVSENPDYPTKNRHKYDFYCSRCFMKLMSESGYEEK